MQLSRESANLTTAQANQVLRPALPGFQIFGRDQPLTAWDLFVLWHRVAMSLPTRPTRPLRNLAHGGPVFLAWHRMFLLCLEQQLQRVTADTDAGLPYWDWAADGAGTPAAQRTAPLWGPTTWAPPPATSSAVRWPGCGSASSASALSCGQSTPGP